MAKKIFAILRSIFLLTLCLLVLSAHNLFEQIRPRSSPTFCRAWSASYLLDTQMVFLKEFFEKFNFEKKSAEDKKKHEKMSQEAKILSLPMHLMQTSVFSQLSNFFHA